MKANFLPTEVAPTLASTITMEGDVDVAVVKYMSSYKGYTPDEIERALRHQVVDADAIKPTLFMLHNKGWLNATAMNGQMYYSLRRDKDINSLRDPQRPTVVRRFKQDKTPIVDHSRGHITLTDDPDVAIWKAMSDNQWRTLKEVIEILRTFGFDRFRIDRRLTTLVRTNRWFDRRGLGRDTVYRLKAHLPCPIIKTAMETALEEAMHDADGAPSDNAPDGDVGFDDTAPDGIDEYEDDDIDGEDEPPVPAAAALIVTKNDTVPEAIWKVLADGSGLKLMEMTVLLSDFGFTGQQLANALYALHKKGTVSREGTRGAYVYKWVGSKPSSMTAVPMTADQTPVEVKTETPTQQEPKEEAMSLLKIHTPLTVPTELLSVSLKVKGMDFTLDKYLDLHAELEKAGFAPSRPKRDTLVQASYTIEGTIFTEEELNELVGKMRILASRFKG